jgi:hypothetical protein
VTPVLSEDYAVWPNGRVVIAVDTNITPGGVMTPPILPGTLGETSDDDRAIVPAGRVTYRWLVRNVTGART